MQSYAEFVPVFAKENTYPFIFVRALNDDVLLCIFNPADRTETAEFRMNIDVNKYKLLAGDKIRIKNKDVIYSIELPPVSYSIYKLEF